MTARLGSGRRAFPGRVWIVAAGLHGACAVALGAFGAHGLKHWRNSAEGVTRLEWWHTASEYQLTHALALGFVAWLASRAGARDVRAVRLAGVCFALGALVFSGTLYLLALTEIRILGAVTPIGGVLLVSGWCAVAWAGARGGGAEAEADAEAEAEAEADAEAE